MTYNKQLKDEEENSQLYIFWLKAYSIPLNTLNVGRCCYFCIIIILARLTEDAGLPYSSVSSASWDKCNLQNEQPSYSSSCRQNPTYSLIDIVVSPAEFKREKGFQYVRRSESHGSVVILETVCLNLFSHMKEVSGGIWDISYGWTGSRKERLINLSLSFNLFLMFFSISGCH